MMTLANYGLRSNRHKDLNSAKSLNKSLQVRNKAESMLKQCLKSHYCIPHEKRSEILEIIEEYYNRVAFELVIWNNQQTKQCIVDSILLMNTRYNPYKAKVAFNTVEQMLVNLHQWPWHKEFRRIYTYSGQFRMIVSDPLIGIEEILANAGFKRDTSNHGMHLILPESKMPQNDSNAESVTNTIFDCLLAQIIMQDIINVFENCQKSTRQQAAAADLSMDEINYCTWIQDYFRERAQNTHEKACLNIQEQLNNVTNHLSKHEFSSIKSGPKNDRQLSLTNLYLNERGSTHNSSQSRNNNNNLLNKTNSLDKTNQRLSTQQQARDFLAQKQITDNNLLKLSDELVGLPDSYNLDANGSKRNGHHLANQKTHDLIVSHQQQQRPLSVAPSPRTVHVNGYNISSNNQQHGKAGYCDNSDTIIEHSPNTSSASLTRGYPIGVDLPHNDCEPLLIAQQQQQQQQLHEKLLNNLPPAYHQSREKFRSTTNNYLTDTNNCGESFESSLNNYSNSYNQKQTRQQQQYNIVDSFDADISPSQKHLHQQVATSNNLMKNLIPLRYETNSSYKKYEPREPDRVFNSNKLCWSCGSCTFKNQTSSEMCAMCNSRRLSR